MISIVDYGVGNVQAIANIYKRLGISTILATSAEELNHGERIILPGVGAFDWAMTKLNRSGMRAAVEHAIMRDGKPILGICVGMQMLARKSDEGKLEGLGWIEGEVRKFDVSKFSAQTHLPHMGWNDVQARADCKLFKDFDAEVRFYFLHSYYFLPSKQENVVATTNYHGTFARAWLLGQFMACSSIPRRVTSGVLSCCRISPRSRYAET